MVFLLKKYIFNNIFIIQLTIDQVEESNQLLVILLLDFEKAYDKIGCNFLKETILHIKFFQDQVAIVILLYTKVIIRFILNGVFWEQFSIQRSMIKEYLLVPYIYILASNVLGHILLNPSISLTRFTLLKGQSTTNQIYTNSVIYIKERKNNLDMVMNILIMFYKDKRAKINWYKSFRIQASHQLHLQ